MLELKKKSLQNFKILLKNNDLRAKILQKNGSICRQEFMTKN